MVENDLTLAAGTHTIIEDTSDLPANDVVTYDNCTDVNVPADGEATCTVTNTIEGGGPPVITTDIISGGGGGGGGPHGQVLGEATSTEATSTPSCSPLLRDYLKIGLKNDADQVKKLQTFLNQALHLNLPVNGIFGTATFNAVKQFQKKYWQDVLQPWFGHKDSGITGQNTPTGYVYQTTRWQINNLFCPGSESFPETLQ